MSAITVADLNNAKTDVDHIARIATSLALTCLDRLGNEKDTVAGAIYKIGGIVNRGVWVTLTLYAQKDIVFVVDTWYVCVVAHTASALFMSDVATKWRVYQGVTTGDLLAPSGSSLSGHIATQIGAEATTVQQVLRELWLSTFRFMNPAQIADVRSASATLAVAAAIQSAIDTSVVVGFERKSGVSVDALMGTIFLPKGKYRITTGLMVTNGYGLVVKGAGLGASVLVWEGAAAGVMFSWIDSRYCRLEDMTLYVEGAYSLAAAVKSIQNTSLTDIAPTANRIKDVEISGNEVMTSGFVVDYTVTDANNDFHACENVTITGYTHSAVYLDGLQSHLDQFTQCNFNGLNAAETASLGQYGIYAKTQAINNQASSFVVDGGAIGGHSVSDFFIGGAGQGTEIKNISSENSDRLMMTLSGAAGGGRILLENVRYDTSLLNVDGYMIKHEMNAELVIINCDLGTNGTTNASYPKIYLSNSAGIYCRVTGTGFTWSRTGTGDNSTQFSPIVVAGAADSYADIKLDSCKFTNQYANTQRSYLRQSGNPGATYEIDAFFGETTHFLAATAPTAVTAINPAYPNQEIGLLFENTNTTIKHNFGADSVMLNAAADFTPAVVPYMMKLKYSYAFGRWMEI